MAEATGIRILLVDDEANINSAYQRSFRSLRPAWRVSTANSVRQAMTLMEAGGFEVLVTDIAMGDLDGIDLLHLAEASFPRTFRLVVSGIIDGRILVEVNMLAHAHFIKPVTAEKLVERIEGLIEPG